eukprot:7113638-Prymnesium_polylepis.1
MQHADVPPAERRDQRRECLRRDRVRRVRPSNCARSTHAVTARCAHHVRATRRAARKRVSTRARAHPHSTGTAARPTARAMTTSTSTAGS